MKVIEHTLTNRGNTIYLNVANGMQMLISSLNKMTLTMRFYNVLTPCFW